MTTVISKILIFSTFVFGLSVSAAQYRTNQQKCYGFPRVSSIKPMNGACMGLVADSRKIGWKLPRKVLFFNDRTMIVSAFGGWAKNRGQVWRLHLENGRFKKAERIFNKTDRTHGLALGPDGRVYFGDAGAIYRFDPEKPNPSKVKVIGNLPTSYKIAGRKPFTSNHPMSEMLFLENGDMVVNVGAPTDDCSEEHRRVGECRQRDKQAHLRKYSYRPATNDYSEDFEIIATGLRNSMALAFNPQTNEVYQAENAADREGTPDEFNVIDLSDRDRPDFGWPFCFGNGERYSGYSNYRTFCRNRAKRPLFLLPAHAAPLDMIYYQGKMFPEIDGHLLMSWHGHRPSGSRIAAYPTDASGRPVVRAGVAAMKLPEMVVDGWQKHPRGLHPKGRPVGMAVDSNGAIFIIDDKNGTLLVVANSSEPAEPGDDGGDPITRGDLDTLFSERGLRSWENVFEGALIEFKCQNCHSDVINSRSGTETLANMLNAGWLELDKPLLKQSLWIRMNGLEGERLMPPSPMANALDTEALKSLGKWLSENM